MSGRLSALMLTPETAQEIARSMGTADAVECIASGLTPYAALLRGQALGWARAVAVGPIKAPCIGALGWTYEERLIWSLWTENAKFHAQEIMKRAVPMIHAMIEMAGPGIMPLHNWVWSGNLPALAWIKATHCFDLQPEILVQGRPFVPFFAKPLEELPSV